MPAETSGKCNCSLDFSDIFKDVIESSDQEDTMKERGTDSVDAERQLSSFIDDSSNSSLRLQRNVSEIIIPVVADYVAKTNDMNYISEDIQLCLSNILSVLITESSKSKSLDDKVVSDIKALVRYHNKDEIHEILSAASRKIDHLLDNGPSEIFYPLDDKGLSLNNDVPKPTQESIKKKIQ